jgi:hypothetical protein
MQQLVALGARADIWQGLAGRCIAVRRRAEDAMAAFARAAMTNG